MKQRRFKWSSVFTILSVIAVLLPTGVAAQGGTTVSFSPSSATATVGDTVNVDVRIANATNLYGAEVHIQFDAARLQVLDDDPSAAGVQVLAGSLFPKSDPSYIAQNVVDNAAGTIDFAITLLAPEAPITGSGTLLTIRFSAQMEGTAQLGLVSTKLADNLGSAIAHTTANGQIVISPAECPTPLPGKNCSDLIKNGGFEENAYWSMPVTPHKADYSTADKHGGSRSVRLGIEPWDADVYSHSSAYQTIHVPANASSVTLTFWAKRSTQETPKAALDPTVDLYDPADVIEGRFNWQTKANGSYYDWQEVLILQAGCYNWLATLMRARSDDGAWTQYSYDLTAFAGQDIVVYFNVINNGYGDRQTWMYVDDVRVDACYDESPCVELVRNHSFEWTGDWTHPATPRTADYTTDYAHTGARSMRHGVVPPTADVYSHSSAYQKITIPSGATNPTLSFWYKAHSQDTIKGVWTGKEEIGYSPADVIAGRNPTLKAVVEDWQEMLILDSSYRLLSGGVVMRQVSNDGVWKQKTYDLSPYKGMTIVLYFNVINDGDGQRTWMYVDDVSVNLCGHQVHFDPSSAAVNVGANFTMDVRVENIGDLYGFDTLIRFDPAILEVVDADAGTAGVQVNRGSWLPSGVHIVTNSADNAAGTIRFAASLLAPASALNGSGDLISIPFRAKVAGSTPVAFSSLTLVDSDAIVMPVDRADGQVTVGGSTGQAVLTGKVQLEGRSNHSGTVVQLDGGTSVTTGSDGSYSFTTTAGSHSLAFSHASYVAASTTATGVAGSTVTVATVTLLGGDVNGDGHVNIFDLTAVGSQFGSTAPSPAAADINGDGVVDIVDIVLLAKNYGI